MARGNDKQKSTPAQSAASQSLRFYGDPTLKQTSHEVREFDDRLKRLSAMMLQVMDEAEGVGLAAPQVGSVCRMVVWMDPETPDKRYVYVNPRIVWCSDEVSTEAEGCLSLPGLTMDIERADEVKVQAQDLLGESFETHLTGFPARIVQHELDHLDGFLIIDRTSKEERKRVLKELRERQMERGQ